MPYAKLMLAASERCGLCTFVIHHKTSGEDAVQFLEARIGRGEPEKGILVLMDIQLAGKMSGIDTVRAIRAHRFVNQTPIMMLTGSVGQDQMRECYSAGADGFLSKPAHMEPLINIFRNLCTTWAYYTGVPVD